MKKILLIVAALVMTLSLAAQNENASYVEMNGVAEREITPDEIYLKIVVTEKDNKGKVSVEQGRKEMFKKLKELNINTDKDLTVMDMSSDLLKKKTAVSTEVYQLKLATVQQVNSVISALNEAGIADIGIIKTDISNIEQIRDSLRTEAALKARSMAEVYAKALDQKIGKALYIRENGAYLRAPEAAMYRKSLNVMADAMGVSNDEPTVEFTKSKLEVSVTIRFYLY